MDVFADCWSSWTGLSAIKIDTFSVTRWSPCGPKRLLCFHLLWIKWVWVQFVVSTQALSNYINSNLCLSASVALIPSSCSGLHFVNVLQRWQQRRRMSQKISVTLTTQHVVGLESLQNNSWSTGYGKIFPRVQHHPLRKFQQADTGDAGMLFESFCQACFVSVLVKCNQ